MAAANQADEAHTARLGHVRARWVTAAIHRLD
jgi:hypothetical protein